MDDNNLTPMPPEPDQPHNTAPGNLASAANQVSNVVSNLAAEQAALVASLVGTAAVPMGFDTHAIHLARQSLVRKRCRAVAKTWPVLASSLKAEFSTIFTRFAAQHALPASGGAFADGYFFTRWLLQQHQLPEPAFIEWFSVTLRFKATTDGVQLRRWPSLLLRIKGKPFRLTIAVRIPGWREFWWQAPR